MRAVKANGVEFVQLAHNERVDGKSRVMVIYGFGRKDHLNQEALKRLIGSISRVLDPDDAAAVQQNLGLEAPFRFLGAKEHGGTYLLTGSWERFGIGSVLKKLAGKREIGVDVEWLLFVLVAQRGLAPGS